MDARKAVTIVYTNYKGVTTARKIIPKEIVFAHNEWHPSDQWLLIAYDIDKQANRSFAMKDIHSWSTEESGEAESPSHS